MLYLRERDSPREILRSLIQVDLLQYDLGCPVQPPATTAEGPEKPESRPRLLPEMGPLWQELGAQLTSPEPTSQLEADRPQLFSVILPGALRARVITGDAHSPAALSKCRSVLRHAQPSGSAWLVDVALVRDSDMHEMAYDAARGEFSTEIILPRQDKLVVAAQMTAGGPWVGVLCFNINPEVQHIEDRPDLVVLAPAPHPRHPGMQLVRSPHCPVFLALFAFMADGFHGFAVGAGVSSGGLCVSLRIPCTLYTPCYQHSMTHPSIRSICTEVAREQLSHLC